VRPALTDTPGQTRARIGCIHLYRATACSPVASDAARFDSLYAGVVAKIFDRLPDATWVYPGHGGDTTLGAERPHLAEWRERGW